MKQPTLNSGADNNWSWPEKTWFQERLNALKAEEQKLRRKPMVVSQKSIEVAAKPAGEQPTGKVEFSPKS